jgi:6-pyruvoyltetrahydropterin/6-carboxytetrahydropterin synthase
MKMTLSKTGRFEAAHWLPRVAPGHKCGRIHGHSYTVRVSVTGEVDAARGWVMDLGELGDQLARILARLDHTTLNEVDGLENPTSERLAAWIWSALVVELPMLSEVEVAETATSTCRYAGT